jgi:hypothetical protein
MERLARSHKSSKAKKPSGEKFFHDCFPYTFTSAADAKVKNIPQVHGGFGKHPDMSRRVAFVDAVYR